MWVTMKFKAACSLASLRRKTDQLAMYDSVSQAGTLASCFASSSLNHQAVVSMSMNTRDWFESWATTQQRKRCTTVCVCVAFEDASCELTLSSAALKPPVANRGSEQT